VTVTLTYSADLSRVRITASDPTNINPYFETNADGWVATGGTFVRSSEQAHQGSWSGKFTPDGATSNARVDSSRIPVTPGEQYRARVWVYCATARSVSAPINWWDSADAYVSTASATPITVAANTWTLLEDTFTAPASAAQGSIVPTLPSTSATLDVLYIDEATIHEAHGLGDANFARVERSTNGITWSTVRGGARVPVSARVAEVDDYEFVAGESNTYRVTPLLVEDFEGVLDVAATGTWVRSQTTPYAGAWCYSSDPALGDSGTSDAAVTIPTGAATVEFFYRVSSEASFDFFRFLVDGVEVMAASGEVPWTHVPVTAHDISAATTVTFRYQKDVSFADGDDAAYVDELVFTLAAQTASITPVLDSVWIKSLARPFLNRAVTVTEFSEVERPSRNGVFGVVGRTLPVAVTDVRGSRRQTLTVKTETLAEAEDFDLVLASGDPIFLHVPQGSVFPGMYAVIEDITMTRRSVRGSRRYFELPLIECAAPGPDVVGATVTWSGIVNAFATWADLVATEATWHDVVERIGDPAEIVVP
jgi:hypothetical protein